MSIEQAERAIDEAVARSHEAWLREAGAFDAWGFAFRGERQRRSLSLRAVARKAKISPAFLSDIERGNRRPTEKMRAKLRAALKVPA